MENSNPEGEVRGATQPSLAQRYEECDLLDAVRPQIMKLNAVKSKEAAQKERSGEGKPTIQKGSETNKFPRKRVSLRILQRNPPLMMRIPLRNYALRDV